MTRHIVTLLAVLSTALSASSAGLASASAAEEQAVRAVIEEFNKTRRARDAKGFASLYAEDAEFVAPDGHVLRGREHILKHFERLFPQMTAADDRDRVIRNVRFVRPDVAAVSTSADGPGVRILDVFVMSKQGRQWKIAWRHGASVRPAQPSRK
jgi:uncharacterized protein (TIGR02246 family)